MNELDRILKSLKVVFPRTTSAETSDTNTLAWALIDALEALKPVKKTDDKTIYILAFGEIGEGWNLINKDLDLTPTTANKLSEAISALVEYMQSTEKPYAKAWSNSKVEEKADEARESFQESQ
jgi:hypothetical protein